MVNIVNIVDKVRPTLSPDEQILMDQIITLTEPFRVNNLISITTYDDERVVVLGFFVYSTIDNIILEKSAGYEITRAAIHRYFLS